MDDELIKCEETTTEVKSQKDQVVTTSKASMETYNILMICFY